MQWQASGAGCNLSSCAQGVPPCQFLVQHLLLASYTLSVSDVNKEVQTQERSPEQLAPLYIVYNCMRHSSQSVIVWMAAQGGLLRALLPNSRVCRCLWSCRCWRNPHLLPGIRF